MRSSIRDRQRFCEAARLRGSPDIATAEGVSQVVL